MAKQGEDTVGTENEDLGIPSGPGAEAPAEPVPQTPVKEPTTPEPPVELTPEDIGKMKTENARLRAGQSTFERKLRESSQKLAEFEGQQRFGGMTPETAEQLMAHPFVQDLMLKTAEYQLKDGVKEVLDRYPDTPEAVKKAVLANPRGFVNVGTSTVEDALWDIEEYLSSLSETTPPAKPEEVNRPSGKEFSVANTNPVTPKSTGDAVTDELVGLIATGAEGINKALISIDEGKYTQEQFDKAVAECERQGI